MADNKAPATPPDYRGRFAPSPTGPLHAGSVMAALASYLDARANHGTWLVRMEDLDPPRESPEAAIQILEGLETLGLVSDEPVVHQSNRHSAYETALAQIRRHTFHCTCSRRDLAGTNGIYPGTCRDRAIPEGPDRALRCRVHDQPISFADALQGTITEQLARDTGDFVIRRRDGLFAYQLAVVVDDAWQGITHVVRGIDLLDSTARQIHLQRLLGLPTPHYAHIPVLVNAAGDKLSKQSKAPPIDLTRPARVLHAALEHLQQQPPAGLAGADVATLLDWGIAHWHPARMAHMTRVAG